MPITTPELLMSIFLSNTQPCTVNYISLNKKNFQEYMSCLHYHNWLLEPTFLGHPLLIDPSLEDGKVGFTYR